MEENNIDGWMSDTELERIATFASRVPENGVIVEVGSWKGRSAAHWAAHAHPSVTIYCFDPFNRFAEFVENTKNYPNIIPVHGLVPVESKYTDPKPIDVFFLDASHYNPSDWNIIKYFLPFIVEDGIISGHDYTLYRKSGGTIRYPDVNLNVHRLEEIYNKKAGTTNNLWWIKNRNPHFDIERYK